MKITDYPEIFNTEKDCLKLLPNCHPNSLALCNRPKNHDGYCFLSVTVEGKKYTIDRYGSLNPFEIDGYDH